MPALRVADAQAEEGNPYNEGEMHFTVTLSPAATHEVAVSYTTRDGTASGDLYGLYGDYEEEYGRTSFAPGETRKTVRVRLIGDWHDEGPETSPWCSPTPQAAPIADGEGIGTIINDDPIPAAWNARFGRTVADQVLDAVEARMGSEPAPGLDVTLAGERLEWPTSSGETATATQDKDGPGLNPWPSRRWPSLPSGSPSATGKPAMWPCAG